MNCTEANKHESPSEAPVRVLDAREFLGKRRMLRFELDGEIYTLRLTKNDRLILTK